MYISEKCHPPLRFVKELVSEIDSQLTSKAPIKGKMWGWGYIISYSASSPAFFLSGKKNTLELQTPGPDLSRSDSAEIRENLLSVTDAEWNKMGFGKGTLHNLKKNAKSDLPFTI